MVACPWGGRAAPAAFGSPLSDCAAVWRGGFAPAVRDLSGFVHDHLLGAESYEASYGINFLR